MTDPELIERFLQGDERAFDELMIKYQSPVYSFVISMVKHPDAASDIFQETFIKVFKKLQQYKTTGSFKSWVFTIASNTALDYLRKQSRSRAQSLEEEVSENLTFADTIASDDKEPDEILVTEETREAVNKALCSLSEEQREIVLLREYSGLTFKEIAEAKNLPIGTVLTRMRRALIKLSSLLKENI